MTDTPVKKVERWLETQGYPLEYTVARLLRAEGSMVVEQGRHWTDTDPLTGAKKARELDVVASLRGDKCIVNLVIECKHIPEPWVIFEHEDGRVSTPDLGATVEHVMAGKPARTALKAHFARSRPPWHLRPSAAFKIVDTRPPRKPQAPDETAAFVASMALTRGAWAVHQATPKELNAITMPALVVEGDLVTLSYDSRGRRKLQKTAFERVTWAGSVLEGANHYIRPDPVMIDVLTTEALDGWVDDATRSIREMFAVVESR